MLEQNIIDISHLQGAIEELSRYLLDKVSTPHGRLYLRKKLRPPTDENGNKIRKPDRTGKYGKDRVTWYKAELLRDYLRKHPNKSPNVNKRAELMRLSWRDIALYKPVTDALLYNKVISLLDSGWTLRRINELTGVSEDRIIEFKRIRSTYVNAQHLSTESTGHSQ